MAPACPPSAAFLYHWDASSTPALTPRPCSYSHPAAPGALTLALSPCLRDPLDHLVEEDGVAVAQLLRLERLLAALAGKQRRGPLRRLGQVIDGDVAADGLDLVAAGIDQQKAHARSRLLERAEQLEQGDH